MTFEIDPMNLLMSEIKDRRMRQRDVALSYSIALRMPLHRTDWPAVNLAIISRWSLAGLERVKKMAWEYARARTNG